MAANRMDRGCHNHHFRMRLYSFFHLNLNYSAVEEAARPVVISSAYWPLLRAIRRWRLPWGIELSGLTLQWIQELDGDWVAELRRLIEEGLVTLVGSGYAQLIGPLVPAEVNRQNLQAGQEVYQALLGVRPSVGLVNEQAFSAGLVPLYGEAGYAAIIMEWENPANVHPEWDLDWKHYPQIACGQHGEEIALLWNSSINFQKFQFFAHGDLALPEYMAFLHAEADHTSGVVPMYGNDAEIFDFRPGRYLSETPVCAEGEWLRIEQLLEHLHDHERVQWLSLAEVLALMNAPAAGNRLHLETAAQPIPVKKQARYNITRWAVTGRDDWGINSRCWREHARLLSASCRSRPEWQQLCELWGSDYRTHITSGRWQRYLHRWEQVPAPLPAADAPPCLMAPGVALDAGQNLVDFAVKQTPRSVYLETPALQMRLDTRHGLVLEYLRFPLHQKDWIVGLVPHGFYHDINWGYDHASLALGLEIPGHEFFAANRLVTPLLAMDPAGAWLRVSAHYESPWGPVEKFLAVQRDEACLYVAYKFNLKCRPLGSLRVGHCTINPAFLKMESLRYATHNGGDRLEQFLLDQGFDHTKSPEFMISAGGGCGATGGVIYLGDARHGIRCEFDPRFSAAMPMLQFQRINPAYFLQLVFSLVEMDDTRATAHDDWPLGDATERWFVMNIKPWNAGRHVE